MKIFNIEKLEKLKKRDKYISIGSIILSYGCCLVSAVLILFTHRYLLALVLTVISFLAATEAMKYITWGFILSQKANDLLKYYVGALPCSDETMRQLQSAVAVCRRPREKFYLQCLMAEQASDRGEIQNAEQIIYSADKSVLEHNQKLAVLYYSIIMEIYHDLGDFESVKRAYADGEKYFDRYGERNANLYGMTLVAYLYINTAVGNFGEAERIAEYHLNNVLSSLKKQKVTSALHDLGVGGAMLNAAKCNFNNGHIDTAASRCTEALKLLPQNTPPYAQAAELMNKINSRQEINT